MANFKKMLEDWISTVNKSLFNQREKYDKDYENEFFKSIWINIKIERINDINKKINDLGHERDKIQWEIKDMNSRISTEKYNEIVGEWYNWSSRNCNESDYFIFKKTKDSISVMNYKNFNAIIKRFRQQMWFAISAKEQRSVLAEFYQLDWLSLWIELPIDVRFDKIIIEEWIIKVTQKLLK